MALPSFVTLQWPGTGIGDYVVLAVALIFAVYVIAVRLRERRPKYP